MDYRALGKNFALAVAAQVVALALSAITSLLIPKVLGVEEFGFWQLFLLYASYTGLFHLGLNDGVYLIFGGTPREQLNSASIASQFRLASALQLIITAAIIGWAVSSGLDERRQFLLIGVALYIWVSNAQGFLALLFQAMNETRIYSATVVLDRMLFLGPLLALILVGTAIFEPYVIAYFVAKIGALTFSLWKAWDLLSTAQQPLADTAIESLRSVRVGVKLMIANIAAMLTLGGMRLIVERVWGLQAFAHVSFSLTLVNFFLVFAGQASLVLFPALRQVDAADLGRLFAGARDALTVVLPIAYLAYFPVAFLLARWLPDYTDSLTFLAVLLPVCIFDGKMNLLGSTFMKVQRRESLLLALNVVAFISALAANLIGALVFNSLIITVAGSVAAIVGRSVVAECIMMRQFGAVKVGGLAGEIAAMALFVTFSLARVDAILAFGVMTAFYLVHLTAHRSTLASLAARIRARS